MCWQTGTVVTLSAEGRKQHELSRCSLCLDPGRSDQIVFGLQVLEDECCERFRSAAYARVPRAIDEARLEFRLVE